MGKKLWKEDPGRRNLKRWQVIHLVTALVRTLEISSLLLDPSNKPSGEEPGKESLPRATCFFFPPKSWVDVNTVWRDCTAFFNIFFFLPSNLLHSLNSLEWVCHMDDQKDHVLKYAIYHFLKKHVDGLGLRDLTDLKREKGFLAPSVLWFFQKSPPVPALKINIYDMVKWVTSCKCLGHCLEHGSPQKVLVK